MNGPSPALVDLAEMLVEQVPHADWAMFQKNGSDATTTCVTIARAGTHKRKILVAKGAYHGAVPWCSPSLVGVTAEDRAHVIHFEYNDVRSLENAIDQASDDLAGVIVTPFRHEMGRPQELADPRFATRLRDLCTRLDAALILDDVRAGCRIDLGGSWEPIGIRPDLIAWSKAIANGYPLAAVTGRDRFREAAASIFVTGSFWCSAAPMVAARTTLAVLRQTNAIAHMVAMGERLRRGLDHLSARHGIPIRQTGPVQMPSVMFEGDVEFRAGSLFCSAALAHGAYLHPKHNMFVSAAHSAADIDRVIDAADQGFLAVRRAGIAG